MKKKNFKSMIIRDEDIKRRSVVKQIMDVFCPHKVFKDKKKYSRREKHRKEVSQED